MSYNKWSILNNLFSKTSEGMFCQTWMILTKDFLSPIPKSSAQPTEHNKLAKLDSQSACLHPYKAPIIDWFDFVIISVIVMLFF